MLGQFINICCGSVGYLLSMTGNELYVRNAILTSGLLCITLTIILVPIYGALGAAISIFSSIAIQNFIMVFYVKQQLGFNTLNLIKQ